MKKPWGGRFEKDTDEQVEEFTESISFDTRLYRQDIRASIVHAEMLAHCGLISDSEFVQIETGLKEIQTEIENGEFEFKQQLEDVHMNVEAALSEKIGEAGMKLHTARSRNDQVACDLKLWTMERMEEVDALLYKTEKALVECAEKFESVIMPGFTHLQHAQPVLLSHVLMAFVEQFGRDRERLSDCWRRADVSPLGACALAGTSLPIEPEYSAAKLGFSEVFSNSVDAASDRDFAIEFAFDLSLIACHMSRLAEEWILWSGPEFDFVDLDESFCTGSSIMPQKKNPDVLELIRGKCGGAYGDLMALLTLCKGQPMAYNRDMQEDKQSLFDAVDRVSTCLSVLSELIDSVTFKKENMARACRRGYADATALANYLVARGVPFREAHRVVGEIVRRAASQDVELSNMSPEELSSFHELITEDVYRVLGPRNCIESYQSHGSSAPKEVRRQIEEWKERLEIE